MVKNTGVAILLLTCSDRRGLVSRISNFVFERGGNILTLEEHVDDEKKHFSIRIAWDLKDFSLEQNAIDEAFMPLAKEFNAKWSLKFAEKKTRIAIFVSKADHCLQEILWRYSINEFSIEIPAIISNHSALKPLADHYGIPYYVFPVTKQSRDVEEEKELKLLEELQIETIVLARYMQILSPEFLDRYPNEIINIHHSFLPAFIGGNPYKQAYDKGVKIIGATSHYVTKDLDEGPIIEQDIIRISHKDTLQDLIRKGRDLERMVLARALLYHSEHRVLVRGKKTVIFA
jgi:formyltetrahydrofolate deformylase